MPPQVWRPGARVSKAHPTEFDTLQPGQRRRKKRRIYGTLTAPVEGETGRFSVRWDDGSTGFGSISGPDKMMHHDSGACELRAKARQAATVMELTNMHQYVAHTDVMVSKLHVGVNKQEQVMEKRFDALEAKIVEACESSHDMKIMLNRLGTSLQNLGQNLRQVGDAMVGRRFDGTAVSPMPRTFAGPRSASDETTALEDPASPIPGNPAPPAPPGPSPPGPTPVAAAAVGTPRPVGSPRPGFLPPRSQICGPRDLWKAFDEGFGDFPPAFDTIRRQPDWTVKLLNSDVKYTYKAKRMLSYILRRKTAEGNVDTVLEELQNDFSAVNGGMMKWMKVKQSLFGDDVSAFTQRIAKRSASIQTHRAAPVVHQVPVDGSTLVHVSS